MKRILVLLSLLGLLLFLVTPALGDEKGGPMRVKSHHVEPSEPFVVEVIFESGGKRYSVAETDDLIVVVPNAAVNYRTQKMTQQRVTRPVDARVIAQVRQVHNSWTAYADGKTFRGFNSREEAMSKAWIAVMDRIDALEDVPDTGGPPLSTMALAGMALLAGGSILLRRIVSW